MRGLGFALGLLAGAIWIAPATFAADKNVTVENFAFSPKTLTISPGDTVIWTNKDAATTHTATADNGSFDTGQILSGTSTTIHFSKAGTYRYHCSVHPSMTGRVVVQGASAVSSPRKLPKTDVVRSSGGGRVITPVLGVALAFVIVSATMVSVRLGRARSRQMGA